MQTVYHQALGVIAKRVDRGKQVDDLGLQSCSQMLMEVDRLLDGKPFLVTPEDAANTSLVILAILESAKKREPVKVTYLQVTS